MELRIFHLSREWCELKWSSAHCSSGMRVQLAIVFSSISKNRRSKSSPVTTEVKWVETSWLSLWAPALSARTHPNSVFRAVGVLWGPDCQPWHISSMKISTPSKMSIFLGLLYSGSVRVRPSRCFQFWLKETAHAGWLPVICGTIKALML